jgi:hypothetical protein
MDYEKSKYFPIEVRREFIFVPVNDLPRHPKYTDHLKRIASIEEGKYKINDLSVFDLARQKRRDLSDFLT